MEKFTLEELKALVKESLSEMDYGVEELPMSAIDMPIQDKGVFTAMDDEEVEDDMSDIAKYRRDKSGDYEGGFQDDVSISPGYFNEEELAEMIREGVEKLHRKSLIENRLEQINDELNMINNPEAWESARTEAKAQLAKKTIAWNNISTRESLMSEEVEPVSYNKDGSANICKSDDDFLAFLKNKKEQEKNNLMNEMSFKDIKLPVSKPKDTATTEADSKWNNMQKESVSEIMGRAADLMAEAKKKYNDISK